MAAGLADWEQLWPPQATVIAGDRTFHGSDVWRSVGRRLATPMGRVLLSRMSDEARTFVHETLLSAGVRPDGRDELRR